MKELALHLLDIAHNSVSANARNITIEVKEDTKSDLLTLTVKDDGKGMDAQMVQQVMDPFVTTRTTRNVGLGIPLLKAAAEACGGNLEIHSTPGKGTEVKVTFQRSHIDRMPLGNLAETFFSLEVGCPEVHWTFIYEVDDQKFEFDDTLVKQELGDVPLSDPLVLSYLRSEFESGIKALQASYSEIS